MRTTIRTWPKEEIETLRRLYPDTPIAELREALPDRTDAQIYAQASRLKLRRVVEFGFAKNAWTDRELELLGKHYVSSSKATIMAKIPGRTWHAITEKAQKFGLHRPCSEIQRTARARAIAIQKSRRRLSPETMRRLNAVFNEYAPDGYGLDVTFLR